MSVYEMAVKYFPKMWNEARLRQLVEAGRLSEEEFAEIVGKGESGA